MVESENSLCKNSISTLSIIASFTVKSRFNGIRGEPDDVSMRDLVLNNKMDMIHESQKFSRYYESKV